MAAHTQMDYAKLLMEYLNKRGLHAVVSLYKVTCGSSWYGDLCLKRQRLIDPDLPGFSVDMNAEAHINVSDEGAIRLYYSEPVVFDMAKKERKEAACRMEEEALRESLTPADEEEFDIDDLIEAWNSIDDIDNESGCDEETVGDPDAPEAAEDEAPLSSEADDEHISERKRLELLEMLEARGCRISIPNRKNETRVCLSAYREMDSCSRNSAKKAVEWIVNQLMVACQEIGWLEKEMHIHRQEQEAGEEKWYDDLLTDSFDNVDTVCRILGKEAEIEESKMKQKEQEEMLIWCEEALRNAEKNAPEQLPFRQKGLEAYQTLLQEEKDKQETLQRERDALMDKLILL